MSDVNSVAEKMGIPADLVSRSADARAAAAGTTSADVLSAWGGGGAVTSAPPEVESTEAPPDEADAPTSSQPEPPAETVVAPPDPAPMPAPIPAPVGEPFVPTTGEPPVLVGVHDNPWSIVTGVIGLFVAVLLLGLVGPSIPVDEPGARTSAVALTEAGLAGRDLYGNLGCAGCHTQMVRPIIADVGIGPVTLSDTNQVLGVRRFGPDLSNIGNRMSGAQMESTISGGAGHPASTLSEGSMDQLVTYLLESAPSGGGS
ncbi:MAG TPA: cbb3-type cytochrome c oxidase subunit II [Acidimicrobiia bacterium]